MTCNQLFFKYGVYYPVVLLKTKGFRLAMKQLTASQYLQPQRMLQLQLGKARRLLYGIKEMNPIYKKKLSGVDPESIVTMNDFRRIPFVDKELVRNRYADFQPDTMPCFCTKKTTGGSTGQAVTLLKSREAMGYELAATWRGYSWAGISIGDKQARFWGVPISGTNKMIARVTDFICNRIRLAAFSYSQSELEQYEREIFSFNPAYFYGYVSMIEEYARHVGKSKEEKVVADLKAIITTSEVLHYSQRSLIEDVFHVKVYNEYGCGEVGTIAHECECGSMHISAENMIIEVLDGDRPCEPGELGEIVVTELNNTIFPLIRYRLGDYGVLDDKNCPCGRKLPILKSIQGRAYDTIQSSGGRRFHGEFFMYIFEEAEKKGYGVAKFQVVQLSIQVILVKIVPSSEFKKEQFENLISNYIYNNLDKNVTVQFEIVDEIPREGSGKLRLIVGLG